MTDAVIEFAKWVIQESVFDGYDLVGVAVQEMALELGLLIKTAYDPEKHGEVEYAEPGSDWYVFSNLLTHPVPSPAPEAQLAARTGAVKVKALEWKDIHQRRSDEDPTTEVVGYEAGIPGLWWRIDVEASDFSLVSPEYSYQTFGTLEAAQAAAQADYERRILSALEPAAPEGQQPVAWMDATGTELHKIIQDYQKRDMIASGGRQAERAPNYSIALFTAPSEQAVSEAMVEAVVQAVRPYTMQTLFIDEHRELVRDALKAAQEGE